MSDVSRETRWCERCGERFDVIPLDPSPRGPILCFLCHMVLSVDRIEVRHEFETNAT